jgi:hypothetical protein
LTDSGRFKTAVAGIFKDVDCYTSYGAELKDFYIRFQVCGTKIEVWMQLWKVDGRLGPSFYERLWGEGYSDVEGALDSVEERSDVVWQAIKRRLGFLASLDRQARRRCRRENQDLAFWTRLCDSLFRIELVNEHLLKLDEAIDRSEQLSRLLVQRHHGHSINLSSDDVLASWTEENFKEDFFLTVAQASQPYSNALYHEFSQASRYRRADIALERLLNFTEESGTILNTGVGAHNVIYDIICHKGTAPDNSAYAHFVITADTSSGVFTSSLPCCTPLR